VYADGYLTQFVNLILHGMPNVTITIENEEFIDDSLEVRLVFYNPKPNRPALQNDNEQYFLKSASAKKILTVIREEAGIYPFPSQGKRLTPLNNLFNENSRLLTTKEKQVLKLLSKGYSYKMIAEELQKSVETIRVQIKSVYKKLNVCSNTQAIIKALTDGLL
jgi:DNA-binding NarL/FixJ family response regulator